MKSRKNWLLLSILFHILLLIPDNQEATTLLEYSLIPLGIDKKDYLVEVNIENQKEYAVKIYT